jgi:acetyltransferase
MSDRRAPSHITRSWPLLHAHSLTVRPLRPEDRGLIVRLGQALSVDSRYNRFLGGGIVFTRELLDRLVNIDYSRDFALIATVVLEGIETPVGVARWARLPDDASAVEFAVTVADAWQRCGIGRLLLTRLIELARDAGVARIIGEVLATNTAMIALGAIVGFRTQRHPEGATHRRLVMDLNDQARAFIGTPDAEV